MDGSGAATATGTVDSATVGVYTITYNASDAAGNVAIAVTRTVNVLDVTLPVITINGDNPLDHLINTPYNDAGASANDAVDGTIMVSTSGTVDITVLGVNTITYTAMDISGNETTATRTVNVVTVLLQPLNDTGIIWGGNYPSGNNTTCIGETIGQQDCSHGRDAQALAGALTKVGAGHAGFDFTKLDGSGVALADQTQTYAANPWACVRDNHTGLVWEVKTPAGSAGIHSASNGYRWGGKTAMLTDPFGTLYNDWDSLVDGSNNNNLCGFNDWRVASVVALQSIINYNTNSPAIDLEYFPNTQLSSYWSSLPFATGSAVGVNFSMGNSFHQSRGGAHLHVRLVRGGQ